MRAVFLAQWRQLLRVPWAFLAMIVMSVIMASVVGYQAVSSLPVTVLPEAGMSATQVDAWLARLGASSAFEFEVGEERAALERLASSGAGLVLRLGEASWTVLAAPDDESAPALAAFVGRVYREELALRAAAEGGDVDALRAAVEARLATPALRVVTSEVAAQDDFAYDSRTQAVFGMGLFFVTFTLLFGVNAILEERRTGLWDRVIVSPASKLSMYGGHFAYTFLTGMAQLLVVYAVFRLGFGVSVGASWGVALLVAVAYVVAITALGMLLAGLVGNAQRMNVVIPIVAVSMAMLGGAYWPIEIVGNRVLLALSQALPMRHAMDALKGLAYHGWGLAQVGGDLAFMAAFALVCTALGVWLVDRRG